MIASSSGSVPPTGVSLTASRYESVADQRVAIDRVQGRVVDLGKTREVLRRVRVEPVHGGAGRDDHDRLLGPVLDRDLAVRQRTRDVEQQPAGDDGDALLGHLRVGGRAQRHLHVGGGQMQAPGLRAQLNASEDEHGGARRDAPRDDRELGRELVARDRHPQSRADH